MTVLPDFKSMGKPRKLPQPKLLTYDDYARLTPPDSGHYELHNGKIIYMPSPIVSHQDVCLNIAGEIRNFIKNNPIGRVFIAPLDTTFTNNDTFQPDVMFVSNERQDLISEKRIIGAPDLVVEVLSEGNTTKEMSYKKHIFESSSVQEYWLVNLKKLTVAQYENIEGEFLLRQVHSLNDTISSWVLKGFSLPVKDIFTTL
jgi:Uma2 family endonuclease